MTSLSERVGPYFDQKPSLAEPNLGFVAQVIVWRIEKQRSSRSSVSPRGFGGRRPKLIASQPLAILFGTPNLWISVGNERFLPEAVIGKMLVRKDGEAIDPHRFSVFIADRKETLFDRYGAVPLSAWSKQKFQYWDESFFKLFFASIQTANHSPELLFNHIAYKINNDVSVADLSLVCDLVHRRLTQTAQDPVNGYFLA